MTPFRLHACENSHTWKAPVSRKIWTKTRCDSALRGADTIEPHPDAPEWAVLRHSGSHFDLRKGIALLALVYTRLHSPVRLGFCPVCCHSL